ncbi:MAG: zinc-ribbon domain-containing protein, partial [Ruminococcus flavefaciens]|nr:zinc-ribbon domain-containing protein [Ruminococcus flavefaciens]
MRYCKKCGAELPEGVSFCEKCGNPVGQVPKQGKGKKKWVIAISSGVVIILAVAIVGVLFAKDVIGGTDNAVQTDAGTVVSTETPSASGEKVQSEKQSDNNEQKNNAEDM